MQKYFIKYQEHNAVGIKTHELKGSSWTQSIFDVGDLVAAFQQLPNSPLSDTFISELTLHLPEGVDKSSLSADGFADSNKTDIDVNPFDPKGVEQNALADDCFSTNSSLRPGLKISQLAGINSDDLHPFIIHKKDSAKDLGTIEESFRNQAWKSTVQLEFVDRGIFCTAIVVDLTDQFIYLLLNLHSLVDDVLTEFVSTEFLQEMKNCKKQKKQKVQISFLYEDTDSSKQLIMDTEFILKSDCCLHASFYSDHAILKVPYTKTKLESCKLSPYPNSYSICDSMNVHVFGFPGSSKDFDHDYAVISCTISGFDRGCLLITGLSAPGLSGSAIVCTVRGWPIGYLGGELTSGESESHQYLTYGYLLSGILRVLTELLPRFQRRKLNKWIDHFFQNAFQTEWNRIIRKQYSLFDLHFILYVQKMDEMIKLRSQLTKINAS